ncbi:intraflagellar transport protein 122 homolog [Anopheles aquasalis]|uniref:intraflagellar transport protein 122 homolog n=1 Tax=Anopheles aquasalis TaxID=42839 RepID=UPI00215AEC2B|nr:intraflagellar transport protein 122 homolog [Anopheles aquasalis]
MRAIPKWVEKIHDSTEKSDVASIHCICYHPEGVQLVAGAGDKVLVYDPIDGNLISTLKGHKDIVYCVAYAKDGKKFASGSADKTVIIWTIKLEGLLKYSHNDSIQCLSFNPISHQLASCAVSDFSFWSPEQKAVQKYKATARINACAWTNDGQYIALGLANGTISIRNKAGEEKIKIDRPGGANSPIFGLAWNPPATSGSSDILCVIDWGQTLSFYSLGGQAIGKERNFGFDPLCLSFFPSGEFLIVAGCNKALQLFTRDGIRLGMLGEQHDSWIWTVAVHPAGNFVVVGCQDGTLGCYSLAFNTVHALYRERYAFRENMCDVIIQHLVSGQKVRIKCRDLVHKIAIYRNRLAVQLPERVVLYELSSAENQPMHYKVREKIAKKFDCSLLVVCAQHLVLCQEKKLQSLDFNGVLQREWLMDSFIRYIKVTGGPAGREGLLLGLKSGQVWRIFLDNSLPILVTTVLSSVRCLDLNATRTKLAVVDDAGRLVVRDLINDAMLYQDSAVNSVAWNTHLDSMLCYSHTTGGLSVRVGSLPPRSPQTMLGVVVGLCGATAFCLRGNVMSNVPLALGATMWQFVEAGMFEDAYQVACLGVPLSDWEGLAQAALDALNFQVARDAYVRVRNLPWLELIAELRERQKRGETSKEVLLAEAYAFAGRFKEAGRLYQKSGTNSKALAMYSDLRMFDLAQEFLKEGSAADKKELIRRRAEWACSVHEPRAAAELLLSAGESERAIEIVAEQGWADVLLDIGRRLAATERAPLELIAGHLRRLKALPLAAEIYRKLGEEEQVVQLHVEARDWPEAFRLAEHLPKVLPDIHFQHAQWLAESDQFISAHEAFISAGRPQEATKLLRNLVECAVSEERYLDAGYYTWLRAHQELKLLANSSEQNQQDALVSSGAVEEYRSLLKFASIYYAYNTINSYLKEPFTSSPPLTLFNTSRFVVNQINGSNPPKGISLFAVYYTLSKQAKVLGANKLHLQINNKLQSLKIPAGIQEQVDISYITSRACPGGFNDPEELLPMCYKCSNYSPHLHGNRCPNCQQEYIFSYVSFEILPLAEFTPERGISEQEAERLLLAPPKTDASDGQRDQFIQEDIIDTFPSTLDRDALRAIDPREVIIVRGPAPLPTRYYRNLLPELQITVCSECNQVFHSEDFELQFLQKGYCPFCRTAEESLMN